MITISLCMIVKNEEDVLGRVLQQMQPIADEIIIVDTGSTDRTKEIAGQFTELVYDYPWQQDFATARNYACSKARMDYWMWLDADDVIRPDQQKQLLALKDTLDPHTDIVMMKYLTGFDQNEKNTFFYYRERLIKNQGRFFWQGKVHEAITPSGHVIYSPIEIEHRKVKAVDNDVISAFMNIRSPTEKRWNHVISFIMVESFIITNVTKTPSKSLNNFSRSRLVG